MKAISKSNFSIKKNLQCQTSITYFYIRKVVMLTLCECYPCGGEVQMLLGAREASSAPHTVHVHPALLSMASSAVYAVGPFICYGSPQHYPLYSIGFPAFQRGTRNRAGTNMVLDPLTILFNKSCHTHSIWPLSYIGLILSLYQMHPQ